MIICPGCGVLEKSDIEIYSDELRKQSFSLLPVFPVCKRCGAGVNIDDICAGGNIIVITGTCGSGKSTVAEVLAGEDWLVIDGDCAVQAVRRKNNRKNYAWDELIDEIAHEIDILAMFGENIVLSHVILPEDVEKYINIFKARGLRYRFFLLKPDYDTAVQRCMARTSHTSITPEKWIKHFYDLMEYDGDVATTIDNTTLTADETARYILNNWEG